MTGGLPRAAKSVTEPERSRSRRAELRRTLSQRLDTWDGGGEWADDGFRADLNLLSALLPLADRKDIRSGAVPTALDFWAAEMLRVSSHRVP